MKDFTLHIEWNSRAMSHGGFFDRSFVKAKYIRKKIAALFKGKLSVVKMGTTDERFRCTSEYAAYKIVEKRKFSNIHKATLTMPTYSCLIVKHGKICNPPKSVHS